MGGKLRDTHYPVTRGEDIGYSPKITDAGVAAYAVGRDTDASWAISELKAWSLVALRRWRDLSPPGDELGNAHNLFR